MKKRTIVLTGGGTAGHIMPNLALVPKLKEHFNNIYYLGNENGMEKNILKEYKEIKFIGIPTTKLVRKFTLKNLAIPFVLLYSIKKTKRIIKQIKPDVIFCKGGYVSVPVAIAGKKCNVPVVSHESDLTMGLANKIILKYASVMCLSFNNTHTNKKCVYTGSPVRSQIFYGNKQSVLDKNKTLDKSLKTILFFGGSLGSKNINELVRSSLDALVKKYNVIHITGKGNHINFTHPHYLQMEFTNKIEDYFALANIVVCRGGANSLFELLALKKPMLIIPLSKAQSRGDQIENAKYFKQNGFADMMLEEDMSSAKLLKKIDSLLLNDSAYIKAMSINAQSNANDAIVKVILSQIKPSI